MTAPLYSTEVAEGWIQYIIYPARGATQPMRDIEAPLRIMIPLQSF